MLFQYIFQHNFNYILKIHLKIPILSTIRKDLIFLIVRMFLQMNINADIVFY